MIAFVLNKKTKQKIEYNNVIGFGTYGTENDKPNPVIQFILTDGTAMFYTNEWDFFILKM